MKNRSNLISLCTDVSPPSEINREKRRLWIAVVNRVPVSPECWGKPLIGIARDTGLRRLQRWGQGRKIRRVSRRPVKGTIPSKVPGFPTLSALVLVRAVCRSVALNGTKIFFFFERHKDCKPGVDHDTTNDINTRPPSESGVIPQIRHHQQTWYH